MAIPKKLKLSKTTCGICGKLADNMMYIVPTELFVQMPTGSENFLPVCKKHYDEAYALNWKRRVVWLQENVHPSLGIHDRISLMKSFLRRQDEA